MMKLNDLFKNTSYEDTLFSEEAILAVESAVFMKNVKNVDMPYIKCLIRDKEIKLTPEEAIRQLYIYKLIHEYDYPISRIQLETPIHFGREVKRADITIMDKDRPLVPYIIVELKKPKLTDGKEQLKSYCNATGAPIGVWTNGEQVSCYNRKDPNFFEMISDIPKASQKLSDILNEKYTYDDLRSRDKISKEKRSLRNLIKEMEDEVLASAGVDSFEEIFKLIFAKLYDELICANDKTVFLQFRNSGDTDFELKEKIQKLFDDAKKKWEGVFPEESKILLSPSHLAVCVSTLQDIKLFNNNLDVVDDAFEYLMSKAQKGEKGQYFTPRYVIDMCVKMMNPTIHDKIIDTACGSSGFTVHSIFKVWKEIRLSKGLEPGEDFTASERTEDERNYVKRVAEGDYRVTHYKVQRTNEKISTLVHKKNDPTTIYFQFEQKKYDETELDVHADFLRLGIEQQGQCKAFYKEICPYVIESVLTRDKDNKVEFIAERSQVSRGIIEVLYLLRCSLMHGEVFPDNNAMEVYKYAYSILAAILKKMF